MLVECRRSVLTRPSKDLARTFFLVLRWGNTTQGVRKPQQNIIVWMRSCTAGLPKIVVGVSVSQSERDINNYTCHILPGDGQALKNAYVGAAK